MDAIKKILLSASHAKRIKLLVYVITEPWICWLQFPATNCDHRVKWLNVTCWMYSTHIVSEIYGDLKSFQIVTSFQSSRVLSFIYIFRYFLCLIQKSIQLIWYKWIIYKEMINKFLIFGIKKIIMISMLPSCNMILPNPHRNIIICFIPLKFCLVVKNYKKENFSNINKVNKLT